MKENSIRRAVREGRAALGTGLKEFASRGVPWIIEEAGFDSCNAHGKLARGSAETEAQIEEYWQLGCKVLNLAGNDVSTYLDGMKARAGRAHARLKSIGVPTP
jgi:hypothetical protein